MTDPRAELMRERERLARELAVPVDAGERVDSGDEDMAAVVIHRDALMADRDRKGARVRAIDDALRRIANGTFGVCLSCGDPLNPRRLAALPTALRCVTCEDEHDREAERLRRMEGA